MLEQYYPSYKSDHEWIGASYDYFSDTLSWGHLTDKHGERSEVFGRESLEQTIGSDWDNDIAINPGPFIGQFHCTIVWDGFETPESNVFLLTKRDASIKTWVNNKAVDGASNTILNDGDKLQFGILDGDCTFTYHQTAHFEPAPRLHQRYEMRGIMSRGTFGSITHATCNGISRAVKRIKPNRLEMRTYEVSNLLLLKELNHAHICTIEEFFIDNKLGVIDIVMPMLAEGDLFTYLMKKKEAYEFNPSFGITEDEVKIIARQICDAMSHVHSVGLIHYDLKAENILISSRTPLTVKVADFGLAKLLQPGLSAQISLPRGTNGYMAPEIIYREFHNNTADSWSVGVMVFSMLTNNRMPCFTTSWELDSSYLDVKIQQNLAPDSAKEFIQDLLKFDLEERMSLTKALEHPWLRLTEERAPQNDLHECYGQNKAVEYLGSPRSSTFGIDNPIDAYSSLPRKCSPARLLLDICQPWSSRNSKKKI